MEHNTDNIIRKKVRDAEQMPASFQSSAVWNKINAGLRPQTKSMLRYYVAAALVAFVIAFAGYFINESQNKTLQQQLSLLEQALVKYEYQSVTIVAASPNCFNELLVSTNTEVCRTPHQAKRIIHYTNPKNQIAKNETTLATVLEGDSVTGDIILPAVARVPNNNSVEPIIGVIIPQKKIITIAREKKVKIRLFKSPDSPIEQKNNDPTIIFARIN